MRWNRFLRQWSIICGMCGEKRLTCYPELASPQKISFLDPGFGKGKERCQTTTETKDYRRSRTLVTVQYVSTDIPRTTCRCEKGSHCQHYRISGRPWCIQVIQTAYDQMHSPWYDG